MAPLSGLRVIDMSRVLAGPWCGRILADLGCDVLKMERPRRGDDTRGWGPPNLKDKDGKETSGAAGSKDGWLAYTKPPRVRNQDSSVTAAAYGARAPPATVCAACSSGRYRDTSGCAARVAATAAARWGEPEDLQGAVVYLASAASDYVNGTVLTVDGGWMAR